MTLFVTRPRYGRRMHRHLSPARTENQMERKISFPVDVKVEENQYLISAILPGVKAEDLDIEITQDTVSISGEFHLENEEDDKYLIRERRNGKFSRSFKLPIPLDADKAKADLKDGILNLHIPKSELAKPRSIKISKN